MAGSSRFSAMVLDAVHIDLGLRRIDALMFNPAAKHLLILSLDLIARYTALAVMFFALCDGGETLIFVARRTVRADCSAIDAVFILRTGLDYDLFTVQGAVPFILKTGANAIPTGRAVVRTRFDGLIDRAHLVVYEVTSRHLARTMVV